MSNVYRTSVSPDLARVSSVLRRYAHFEGEAGTTSGNTTSATTDTQQEKTGTTTAEAKFTQADLDRIAGETRQRATEAARKKLLEELGIEDPAADAELLKAARAQREADKTEMQKAAESATKAIERAEKAEAALAAERSERILDRRNSKIEAKAGQAHDVKAVLEWATRSENAALLAKTVNEDGTVNEKAVDTLIAECQKNAAHLWKRGGVGSPSNQLGRVPTGDKKPANLQTSGRL